MPPDPLPDWLLQRRREVGDRIRSRRLWANLTQERLAELAELDRQAINRIENGHTSPRLDTLMRIARALGVPPSSLLPDE